LLLLLLVLLALVRLAWWRRAPRAGGAA